MAETLHKIKFTHDTFLKKNSVAQAKDIAADQKYFMKAGIELPILAAKQAGTQHMTVTFTQNVGTYNTWNVFSAHAIIGGFGAVTRPDAYHISNAGIDFIAHAEGLRLHAYRCSAGVWTIGLGHTKTARPGMTITRERAYELFRQDIGEYETAVNRLISRPMKQHEFDAFVSFAFNCGIGALQRSSARRAFNAGDIRRAGDRLLPWNKAGGKVIRGLQKRREKERLMLIYGKYVR